MESFLSLTQCTCRPKSVPVRIEIGGQHFWGGPISPSGVIFQNLPEFNLNVVALPRSMTGTVIANAQQAYDLGYHKVAVLFVVLHH